MKRMLICAAAAMAAIGGGGVAAVAAGSGGDRSRRSGARRGIRRDGRRDRAGRGTSRYNVPPGPAACSSTTPARNLTPDAGKFLVTSRPGREHVHLIGEGIRTDIPGMHEWQWNFNWFGAGCPAGRRSLQRPLQQAVARSRTPAARP